MEKIILKKRQGVSGVSPLDLEVKDLSRNLLEKEIIKLRNQVAKLQGELKIYREPHHLSLPPLHLDADGCWYDFLK
jgi:hypothetical protein